MKGSPTLRAKFDVQNFGGPCHRKAGHDRKANLRGPKFACKEEGGMCWGEPSAWEGPNIYTQPPSFFSNPRHQHKIFIVGHPLQWGVLFFGEPADLHNLSPPPPHTRPVDSPCPTSSSPAHASILDLHTISLWHPSQVHKRGRLTYFALLFVFVVFLLVEIIT